MQLRTLTIRYFPASFFFPEVLGKASTLDLCCHQKAQYEGEKSPFMPSEIAVRKREIRWRIIQTIISSYLRL